MLNLKFRHKFNYILGVMILRNFDLEIFFQKKVRVKRVDPFGPTY